MADVTISALPMGTPSGNSIIPMVNNDVTQRTLVSSITANLTPVTSSGLAKAWVLFNGGNVIGGDGSVSLYSSYNVSKVVRTQQGVYSIYLVTPMADTNHAIAGTVPNTGQFISAGVYSSSTRSTSIIYVSTGMSSSNLTDMNYTSVIVFGN